jgi:hypothetical protein
MKACRANLGGISPQHDIQTVISMRWGGMKNGALLQLLEAHDFDVFITGHKICRTSSNSSAARSPC